MLAVRGEVASWRRSKHRTVAMADVAFMHGMARKNPIHLPFLAYQCITQPKAAITSNISTSKKLNRFADPETPYKTPAFELFHDRTQLTFSNIDRQQEQAAEKVGRAMMTKKGGATPAVAVAVAVVLLAAAAASVARADVSCADVDTNLRPCVGYVTGKVAAPAAECCDGVKQIRGMPTGTAERRQACECIKQAAAKYQPLNADAIRDLPAQCGAPLPFPLSLNFDCTTIP